MASVLASSIFRKSPGLARFLAYICERYFADDTDNLKEYSIAIDVFRRPESFTPTEDSIVRVEAHRLRKRLREFYKGEGSTQLLEISIATGQYAPQFIRRDVPFFSEDVLFASEKEERPVEQPSVEEPLQPSLSEVFRRSNSRRSWIAICSSVLFCLFAITLAFALRLHPRQAPIHNEISTTPTTDAAPPGGEVRIRCGYTRDKFRDGEGNLWMGDRYFTGGYPTELPNQYIAGTRDPQIYLTLRSGAFSYDIPVQPGSYELRLHFAETTYSPESTLGGGENSRVFNVRLNGKLLLSQFDIDADAGANTADVRVFKDVHPDASGHVRVDFSGSLGLPMVNAVELLPGTPGRLHTIRMVAQNEFFTDSFGEVWEPDSYFSRGKLAADKVAVTGTGDPGLYLGQRYGNFSYALPVDPGILCSYSLLCRDILGHACLGSQRSGKPSV
jgi:hypothetical protein